MFWKLHGDGLLAFWLVLVAFAIWNPAHGDPLDSWADPNHDTVIAVIDSGKPNHPYLPSSVYWADPDTGQEGPDFTGLGLVDDCIGHTTMMESVIYHGFKRAKFMNIRITGCNQLGDVQDFADAVNWAAAHGADMIYTAAIVSPGWSGQGATQALCDAIANSGVLFVSAAGNEDLDLDQTTRYPGSCQLPNQIVVTASDQDDNLAVFPVGGPNHGPSTVTVAAPGVDIPVAVPITGHWSDPSGFTVEWGTTLASARVAGLAAALLSHSPGLGASTVKLHLLDLARPSAGILGQAAVQGVLGFSDVTAYDLPGYTPPPPPGGGLAAHWDLDAGSGNIAVDETGSHDAILNGPTWVAGGVYCGGNDNAEADGSGFGFTAWSGITVAARIKSDVGNDGNTHDIASWWNYGSGDRGWILTHHKNGMYFAEIGGKGYVQGGQVSTNWTHVAFTYDGATLRLYVNGAEVASAPMSGPLPSVNANVRLCHQMDGNNGFLGEVDDVVVYSRALDASEIAGLQ